MARSRWVSRWRWKDALRTIEIMTDEIAEGDIRITRLRNEQVEDRCDRRTLQGHPYRWIDLKVLE